MTIQILNDFHGDGVFRDQQGTIWVRQSEMVDGMARAWDEAAEETHALGWLHDFSRSDALARNPYRKEQS